MRVISSLPTNQDEWIRTKSNDLSFSYHSNLRKMSVNSASVDFAANISLEKSEVIVK